jgi:hypothetical protein
MNIIWTDHLPGAIPATLPKRIATKKREKIKSSLPVWYINLSHALLVYFPYNFLYTIRDIYTHLHDAFDKIKGYQNFLRKKGLFNIPSRHQDTIFNWNSNILIVLGPEDHIKAGKHEHNSYKAAFKNNN